MSAKPTNRIPKLAHHKASGQARVRLSGRDIYTGTWGTPEAQTAYDSLIQEWLSLGRKLPARFAPISPKNITVTELVVAYDKHAEATFDRRTWLACIRPALRRLRAAFGPMPAAAFEPRHLRALRQSMVEEVAPDGSRLSRGYINKKLVGRIKTVFAWAADDERSLVPASVCHALNLVKPLKRNETTAPETSPVRPVPDDVVDATLPHLPGVVADMVRIQRLTGARPDEVCRMTWSAIDRDGDVWVYRLDQHKTAHHGHARTIAIGPKAQAVLMKYQARDESAPLFSPKEAEAQRRAANKASRKSKPTPRQLAAMESTAKAPRRRYRTRYTPNAYALAVRRAVRAAFRPDGMSAEDFVKWECPQHWHPNQLRHTHATEVRRTHGLDAAGASLGHSKTSTTEVYAERASELAATVARNVG